MGGLYHFHLKEEQMENYNKMTGRNINVGFDNKILLLPLNFWFCKEIGSACTWVKCFRCNNNN